AAAPRAAPHDRRRSVQAPRRGSGVVLDSGLPALHAARDHAIEYPRSRRQRAAARARELQDRRAALQHGVERLQEVPELPPQARMPAAVQGVPGRIGVAAGVMMRRSLVLAAVAALLLGRETIGLAQDSQYVIGPDGKISLPLVNDVQAGGLTPSQLRDSIKDAARRFVEDPSVTVVVKQINSRKVFITGQIEKPGPYPINGPTSVVQLISLAGGL